MTPQYTHPLFQSTELIHNRAFLVCDGGKARAPFTCYIPPHELAKRLRYEYSDGTVKPRYIIRVKKHVKPIRDAKRDSAPDETPRSIIEDNDGPWQA